MNARSVAKKTSELQALSLGKDLIFCVESWLNSKYLDCELLPCSEFTIHRRDRESRKGGGVFLAVKNHIPSRRRGDLESDAEILVCELRPNLRRKILAIVFYRPPDSDIRCLKELKKTLLLASKANFDQLLLIGDFNLSGIDWSTGTSTSNDSLHNYFSKLVNDNYLFQLVDFPTRKDNVLDLILTNIPDKFQHIHGYDDIISTDHKLISFELNLKVSKQSPLKRKVYNFKNANWIGLKEYLDRTPWDLCFIPDNIDVSLANWNDFFLSAVDEHIPKLNIKNSRNHPWIDNELRSMLKKKDAQRKKAIKSGSLSAKSKYRDLRRATKKMISQKRKGHAEKLKNSITENPKRFWQYVKSQSKGRSSLTLLRDGQSLIFDNQEMANTLNRFFHSVFSSEVHPAHSARLYSTTLVDEELSHIRLNTEEVENALLNLNPNKANGPDNIPGALLKNTACQIAPSLCQLFNLSLSLGTFPSSWKKANITPVFKQKDDATLPENYRPVSLLPILSKVLERCVYSHCFGHLDKSLYNLQHGFRQGKSTVTQLLEVYNDILDKIAGGSEVHVVHLDLSKAFDKVSHSQLLSRLQEYNITGPLLNWFRSYLTNRQQRVVLNGSFSSWLPVTSGVPQGSILGPLLFLVYANDMPNYVKNDSIIALYADDSKLYHPIDNLTSHLLLQADIDGLHKWSIDFGMEFSPSKCKVLQMSRKKNPTKHLYYLAGKALELANQTKDLGVIVTTDMSWKAHIDQMCTKTNKLLGLVKRICCDITDTTTRQLLYCSLVRPHLEYASNVWSPYMAKYKALIENIQRRATKFILNYPAEVNYKQRLEALNLLPLEFRREINDLILLYKIRNETVSISKNPLIQPSFSYRTRNSDFTNFKPLYKHKQDYYRHSYFPRSVSLWNSLPLTIKEPGNLQSFKKKIRSLYFQKLPSYHPP